jgi:hypothetical protein
MNSMPLSDLRAKQEEVIDKVAKSAGIAHSDVIVDIRRVGKDRIIWSARTPTASEREARDQQIMAAATRALQMAKQKSHVYASVHGRLRAWLMGKVGRVYLSERGARDAGGEPVKVEVRA